jgi:hypothetical protein
MDITSKTEVFFYSLTSGLLGVVAYFIKQLHSDFKRVEKDVSEIKSASVLTQAEIKRINDLHDQRILYLEKRNDHFESLIFKKNSHGKERNDVN